MKCGLLGEHLGHSWSPQIHKYLGDYSYDLIEVAPNDLEEFLLHGDFDGLNVTIPYKRDVIPYCSELSDAARAIGSVNTIVRLPDGSLRGDNTDLDGFRWLLSRNGGICPGEKALVLGNGGASQTVQAVLRQAGANVVVVSRSGENNYSNLHLHADAAVIINATPIGMYPNTGVNLIDFDQFPSCRCALDLIYNPLRTAFLMDAEAHHIRCENGLSMLVAQAKVAAERFTASAISDAVCDRILADLSAQMRNIVLIGMPGSGKSTIGRKLAEKLGRLFVDADTELEQQIGSIPSYFAAYGEEKFREKEIQILADLGKRSGLVLSTGGGCITRSANYASLHQNAVIVWIQRDISVLPKDGRPVSQSRKMEDLYRERAPLYTAFSDCTVCNEGDINDTVRNILEAIK